MSAQHTPLVWGISWGDPIVITDADCMVALIEIDPDQCGRHTAFAHMIAAAPDMLAALRDLVDYAAAGIEAPQSAWDAARAAIGKADGR